MRTNFNSDLKYPYGVLDPRNTPNLYDVVLIQGEDLTHRDFVEEIVDKLRDALREYGTLSDDDYQEPAEALAFSFEDGTDISDHRYAYKDDEISVLLTELGGAPLLYIVHTKWITYCELCSPCVPGAGNIDEPLDPSTGGGVWVLAPHPDDLQDLANSTGKTYHFKTIGDEEVEVVVPQEQTE